MNKPINSKNRVGNLKEIRYTKKSKQTIFSIVLDCVLINTTKPYLIVTFKHIKKNDD